MAKPHLKPQLLPQLIGLTLGAAALAPAFAQDAPQQLEAVEVRGVRATLKKNLAEKRESGNIVDSISAEDVGKFPDKNVADSLQRVPGISVDRIWGEGKAIFVRGTDKTGEVAYQPVVPAPILVGFAAETGSLERAADKLRRKGVDLLVANDVSEPGSGFGTDTNRVTILAADGSRHDLPLLTKREVADAILDRVAAALDARDAAAQTGR